MTFVPYGTTRLALIPEGKNGKEGGGGGTTIERCIRPTFSYATGKGKVKTEGPPCRRAARDGEGDGEHIGSFAVQRRRKVESPRKEWDDGDAEGGP